MLASSLTRRAQPVKDYTGSVDPFIGVDWGGNTFVGSTIPYGMVKLGPDMETFDGRHSGFGYSSYGNILGFSHLHLSGAQGKYGNILVAPVTGLLDVTDIRTPRTDEVNHVGYYAANLTRYQVKAELTSSRRVGFHRYTFPCLVAGAHHGERGLGAWDLVRGMKRSGFLARIFVSLSDHEVQGCSAV